MHRKKIVLITSGQPSLNPRLVKEADTLCQIGHEVVVLYQYRNNWGTAIDEKLLRNKQWVVQRVGGDPTKEKTIYQISRLRHKIGQLLARNLGFRHGLAELAIGRCTADLIAAAKQIPANLYIAHNLAALPAAVLAAEKNMSTCGFDAEDFHRNEVSDDPQSFEVRLKTFIEDRYFTKLSYLTTASPLITLEYLKCYPSLNPITILNAFPKQQLEPANINNEGVLKLFWFSQTIGRERGIEDILGAMGSLPHLLIELHLLGDFTEEIKIFFDGLANGNQLKNVVFYYKPIPEAEIFSFAQQFHVGLATERAVPRNRDICLTNKIFTYVQSGLAILASNTTAQTQLLADFPNMGFIYNMQDKNSLATALKQYCASPEILRTHQNNSNAYGSSVLNWETEQEKLILHFDHILS